MFRGEAASVPRDNVVFELGLFLGALGRQRCAFVMPSDREIRLPTDLLGLTPLKYRTDRADGNLIATIGPSANQIRRMLRGLGVRSPTVERAEEIQGSIQDYVEAWNAPPLAGAREVLRLGIPPNIQEDENGRATAALRKVFNFLEGLANAVISGWLDEMEVRTAFGDAMLSTWRHACTYFPIANSASDAWNPPPSLSVLAARWRS